MLSITPGNFFRLASLVVLGVVILSESVSAAIPVGAPAPDFTALATQGGKPLAFSLGEELKKGPVVLYFEPRVLIAGCTVEAHEFAKMSPQFNAMNAQVIVVSKDDLATLQKFSASECGGQFSWVSDADLKISGLYKASLSSSQLNAAVFEQFGGENAVLELTTKIAAGQKKSRELRQYLARPSSGASDFLGRTFLYEAAAKTQLEESERAVQQNLNELAQILAVQQQAEKLFSNYSKRISYLITPDGKVCSIYSDPGPSGHPQRMFDALKEWHDKKGEKTDGVTP